MSKIAWIGLGVMGGPMAGHLQNAGHEVTVYNRTSARAQTWVDQYAGAMAHTPAQAAKDCDFVFACVGNDDDLRAVTTGENGAFGSMKDGAIFVDHTTASAALRVNFMLMHNLVVSGSLTRQCQAVKRVRKTGC